MSPRARGEQHSKSIALEVVSYTTRPLPGSSLCIFPPLCLVTGFMLKVSSFYVALEDLEVVILLSLSLGLRLKPWPHCLAKIHLFITRLGGSETFTGVDHLRGLIPSMSPLLGSGCTH